MKLFLITVLALVIQIINAFPQSQLSGNEIVVAKDGSGKFNSIQAAVNSLSKSANSERVIYIKNGTYREQVSIQKDFVTLIGENKDKVIITYDLNNAKTGSSSECATVKAKCSNFKAFDITFENTAPFPGDNAQAPAFYSYGNKHYIENCNFLSYQDTLLSYHGTQYFKNCYIRGLTDFIWGFGRAVFDDCKLHVVSKGGKNTGYLTANGNEDGNFKEGGFLITNSKVTSDGAKFYLGRLWKKNCYVIFDKTEFPGDKIVKEGWLTFSGYDNYKSTSKVGEYQCKGSNYNTNGRVSWSTKFNSAPSISSFLGGDLSFVSNTVYKQQNNNNTNNKTVVKTTTTTKQSAPTNNNNNNNNAWNNWDWNNWNWWGQPNNNNNVNNNNNNNNNSSSNNSSSNNNGCNPLYYQCGGKGFKGSSCCKQGSCKKINDYFSMCS
ncbi:hypothetical protein BCR36DRAFT_579233 [Piromyces finnis]|uniref:pectinesterase n=1 Tax=Piromyces finnis TaxID=1754191 RepID=A0A1Y1VP54_9FUNG|nr:hypothetical protein BCR36DRAFT_579233 [Piromyces finnis]|eukprot:ORX61195.1 hypothetical protein BCR36DRAFT_579233 [Piromyces finnis]